ncbi:tetratricopeptide repeat protein [Sphingomonas alpina]|uniref:Tetratricopeptide repeat protein n=1 Tax=Sphingomonas alpina TaxID=653931 RepID=A0A7H0LKT8_9SPHN|nr:tetratricopeptide repeat protein [Sphingomonas alpina]QNQ10291.1 tetratricopeptide repeat protein [Sphingomonas alpina]
MAVPPNPDEAFLREVDEELRRDQLASVWTRYGRWLILAVVAALALFGGFLYWQHHKTEAAGKQGEELQAVVEDPAAKPANAKVLQELAGSNVEGYRATAKFAQADALLQKKDLKGAAGKLAEIAADTSLDQPFRDLALVRQTSIEFDDLKPDVIVNRLRPLAVKGNPWFGSAGELVAGAYLRMNRKDLAGPLFGQIAREETVPATLRQRAVQMAGVLGVDAVETPEEKKAP